MAHTAELTQIRIGVSQLTIGMFVSGLDCPWNRTPFPLQGFYIRDHGQINTIRQYCQSVTIDTSKHIRMELSSALGVLNSDSPTTIKKSRLSSNTLTNTKTSDGSDETIRSTPLKVVHGVYDCAPPTPLAEELKASQALKTSMRDAMVKVSMAVKQGKPVPVDVVSSVASGIVQSLIRNPDAMTWLMQVKDLHTQVYEHSMRSAVWAVIFGRHIGMSKDELHRLALAILLKDVGKAKLPKRLVNARQRTPSEEKEYRSFIDQGVDLLESNGQIDPRVIQTIRAHCERFNGSGFPIGLRGSKIPPSARIAGLVSYYDELLYQGGDQEQGLTPLKAISCLYQTAGTLFAKDLVIEFIRAVGIYPTGSVVELSSGEIAVVMGQNVKWRLRPEVLVVRGADGQRFVNTRRIDLARTTDPRTFSASDQPPLVIRRDRDPSEYAIDVASICEHYLLAAV